MTRQPQFAPSAPGEGGTLDALARIHAVATDSQRAAALRVLHARGAADLIPMLGLDGAKIRMTTPKGTKR